MSAFRDSTNQFRLRWNDTMKNKAFSLIELLVVVAIIGILATIITPNVIEQMRRAKITKTASLIGNIETAVTLYENAFGKFPPSYNPQELYIALNQEAKNPIDFDSEDIRLFDQGDQFWINPLNENDQRRVNLLQQAGVPQSEMVAQIEENGIIDAWGNPLYFVSSDVYNPGKRSDFRSRGNSFNLDAPSAYEMRDGQRFRPYNPTTFQIISFGPDQSTITPRTSNGGLGSMLTTDKKDNDGDGFIDLEDQVRRGNPSENDPEVLAEDDITNF